MLICPLDCRCLVAGFSLFKLFLLIFCGWAAVGCGTVYRLVRIRNNDGYNWRARYDFGCALSFGLNRGLSVFLFWGSGLVRGIGDTLVGNDTAFVFFPPLIFFGAFRVLKDFKAMGRFLRAELA